MIEQLQQRAQAIRQVLHEHPERGADLLMDFARRFAGEAQLDDQVILLKIELLEAQTPGDQKAIVERLEQITAAIVQNYNPTAVKDFLEKEDALSQAIRKQIPPNDVVLEAKNITKRYASSNFTLRLEHLDLRLGQITGLVGECHYGCGGVQASLMQKDFGILNPWLRNVRDVYRMHKEELNELAEIPRARRLVEHNVIEQCLNVTKTAVVQESYLARGYPTVHGWVFDMSTGLIKDLNIDFNKKLRLIAEVYNLGLDKD